MTERLREEQELELKRHLRHIIEQADVVIEAIDVQVASEIAEADADMAAQQSALIEWVAKTVREAVEAECERIVDILEAGDFKAPKFSFDHSLSSYIDDTCGVIVNRIRARSSEAGV